MRRDDRLVQDVRCMSLTPRTLAAPINDSADG